jgi:hypothetical protein
VRLSRVALLIPDYASAIAFFEALGWSVTADRDEGRKR